MSRPVDKLLADLLDAVGAAEELVGRGRAAYDTDRLLRLAGEAVVGRIGDAAGKLRDLVSDDLPGGGSLERCDRQPDHRRPRVSPGGLPVALEHAGA